MATPLDCTQVEIGSETIERGKYVRLGDGSFAKRVVIVTGGDPMDCDTNMEGTETLMRKATVKIADGQYADQIVVTS